LSELSVPLIKLTYSSSPSRLGTDSMTENKISATKAQE
jgi:hypothetical protein